VALKALIFAIPNVVRITIIMALFYSIFSVISISYFKGKLFYCRDWHEDMTDLLDDKWDCMNIGGSWVNRIYNWDNISNSMVALFVMATTAGWGEMMIHTVISRGENLHPQKDLSMRDPYSILFYTVFMLVGSIFFLNLFVGVVQTTFRSEKEIAGGEKLLTDKQKEWIDLKLLVLRSAPIKHVQPPKNIFRRLCFKIANHRHFEKFIQFSIMFNTFILMFKWYRMHSDVQGVTDILNNVFTLIFVGEAIVRIFGIGWKEYLKDAWNVFDFIVATISLIGGLIALNTEINIKGTSILRAFRILRLLRLLRRGGQSLNNIFNTFVITM
jgi:hypothetical protein